MSREALDAAQEISDDDLAAVAQGIEALDAHRPTREDDDDDGADGADDGAEDTDETEAPDDGADDAGDEDDDADEAEDAAAGSADTADDAVDDAADESDEPRYTRDDGAQWNAKAGRWQKDGKFVEGEPPTGQAGAAAAANPGAAAGAAGAAGQAGKAATQESAATGWEPFAVSVNRSAVPIPEAAVSRANGHVFLGIPEEKFADFQRRIVRGIHAEDSWRQLEQARRQADEERRLAAERPRTRSDDEVEADILIDYLKPHLNKLFTVTEVDGEQRFVPLLDPDRLENLELKIQLAQRDEQQKLATWEQERTTRTAERQSEEQTVLGGIADTIIALVDGEDGKPSPYVDEFKDLTDEDLKQVMAELRPISRAVFYRDGTEWVVNSQLVYDRLTAKAKAKASGAESGAAGGTAGRAGQRAAGASDAGRTSTSGKTSATSGAGAAAATPPQGGTTASGTSGKTGERFNQAQSTAAKPTTTNVKAGRTGNASGNRRPSDTEHHRRSSAHSRATPAQKAEDDYRRTTRDYLKSTSLDF